jgi:hypothetical protein
MIPKDKLPISIYIKQSLRMIDGITWAILCVLTALCAIDLFFQLNAIPLREVAKPGKAAVLLAFTPLIVFLTMIVLRQLPFAGKTVASWFRAVACIIVFLIINF